MNLFRVAARVAATSPTQDLLTDEGYLDATGDLESAAEEYGEDEVKQAVFRAFNKAFGLDIHDLDSWSFDEFDSLSLENLLHEVGHQVSDPGFFRDRRSESLIEGEMGENVARGFGNPEGETSVWGVISQNAGVENSGPYSLEDAEKIVAFMESDAKKATGGSRLLIERAAKRARHLLESADDEEVDFSEVEESLEEGDELIEEETAQKLRKFHLLLKVELAKLRSE